MVSLKVCREGRSWEAAVFIEKQTKERTFNLGIEGCFPCCNLRCSTDAFLHLTSRVYEFLQLIFCYDTDPYLALIFDYCSYRNKFTLFTYNLSFYSCEHVNRKCYTFKFRVLVNQCAVRQFLIDLTGAAGLVLSLYSKLFQSLGFTHFLSC